MLEFPSPHSLLLPGIGAVRKVPGASLTAGAELLSQNAGESALLTRLVTSVKRTLSVGVHCWHSQHGQLLPPKP